MDTTRLDRTRVLERRRASFTGFFSVSSFSWWPRVGDLQTVPNPRWQRKFKVRGVVGGAGGSGDLFGKKERENGARSKNGFHSSIANNFCSRSLFYTFSSFFFGYRKIFQWFLPMLHFIPLSSPSRNGIFLFDEFWKVFSILFENILFFFRNRLIDPAKLLLRNVIDIFFLGMILSRCNTCRGN